MITLEKYNIKFIDDFVDFVKEFQKYGDQFGMMEVMESVLKTFNVNKKYDELTEEDIRGAFPSYLKFIEDAETFETLQKKDWVEADWYVICKDGKLIGEMIFRKRLSPFLLLNSLGHISYKIKYTERGKGYGSLALGLMLKQIWRNYHHTEISISCEDGNEPSSKVIEKNGGILNRINDGKKEYWVFRPR